LGSRGQLGSAAFGRYGENVFVNAATGNLMVNRTDEILIGLGPDDTVGSSYNSLGGSTDDNGDNWQLSLQRSVGSLVGTAGASGSTVIRTDWDGSKTVYTCDANGVYTSTAGAGAYDHIKWNASDSTWRWTDGNSGVTEVYDSLNSGRITSSFDTDGNTLAFAYAGNLLTKVTTADGEHTDLTWSGNNIVHRHVHLHDLRWSWSHHNCDGHGCRHF